MHNYYLTRNMDPELLADVEELARIVSQQNASSIELVALNLMSQDTVTNEDHEQMVLSGDDASFLFLVKGYADIDAASRFMDSFMDGLAGE